MKRVERLRRGLAGHMGITLPRPAATYGPAIWKIYELPCPNVGDYSPTEVVTAGSSNEIIAVMGASDFDFTKTAVLSTTLREPLAPARDIQLTVIRSGLHLMGHREGTSLVVLPQQFSNCLRVLDERARLIRADLYINHDTGVGCRYRSIFACRTWKAIDCLPIGPPR